MIALTVAWLIAFFFATLFQILPIMCNWINCPLTTNYPVMYVMCSVTDIILDIVILCLPASFLWKLQMSKRKKIGVAGIFGLGILYVFTNSSYFRSVLTESISCIVSSIARLVYAVTLVAVSVDTDFAANFDSKLILK